MVVCFVDFEANSRVADLCPTIWKQMLWDTVDFVTDLGKENCVRTHIFSSALPEDALCVVWLMKQCWHRREKIMTVGPLRTSEASSSYLLGESLWKWDKEYGGGTESEGPAWVRMV